MIHEIKETKTKEVTQVVSRKTECDLCHAQTANFSDWAVNSYETADTTITMEIGESWPDNGWKEVTEVDICPKCFKDKLIPWLASQGAVPRTETIDW